jgi:hypothetical protein
MNRSDAERARPKRAQSATFRNEVPCGAGPAPQKKPAGSGRAESRQHMNIGAPNPGPQSPAPPADAPDPDASPKKKRRATGEQIRRLVREESDFGDPITVARGLVDSHPELATASFRWLVRQVASALALEQLRDAGVTPQG